MIMNSEVYVCIYFLNDDNKYSRIEHKAAGTSPTFT